MSAMVSQITGVSPVTGWFPSQRARDAEMFPFDDAIMTEKEICKSDYRENKS